jgi:hypothetical protein
MAKDKSRQSQDSHPAMTFTLRLDWTGNSGDSWIDTVCFFVKNQTVAITITSANSTGRILSRNDRQNLSLKQGRKLYRNCLDQGYRPVSTPA